MNVSEPVEGEETQDVIETEQNESSEDQEK